MNLAPRQHDILNLARERGYVSIDELAQAFAVTPQTIRRDINQLAEQGLLRRTHGGAASEATAPAMATGKSRTPASTGVAPSGRSNSATSTSR